MDAHVGGPSHPLCKAKARHVTGFRFGRPCLIAYKKEILRV